MPSRASATRAHRGGGAGDSGPCFDATSRSNSPGYEGARTLLMTRLRNRGNDELISATLSHSTCSMVTATSTLASVVACLREGRPGRRAADARCRPLTRSGGGHARPTLRFVHAGRSSFERAAAKTRRSSPRRSTSCSLPIPSRSFGCIRGDRGRRGGHGYSSVTGPGSAGSSTRSRTDTYGEDTSGVPATVHQSH